MHIELTITYLIIPSQLVSDFLAEYRQQYGTAVRKTKQS